MTRTVGRSGVPDSTRKTFLESLVKGKNIQFSLWLAIFETEFPPSPYGASAVHRLQPSDRSLHETWDFQMPDMPKITEYATAFRRATDKCKVRLLSESLKGFPSGSCGDISDMLGTFLSEVIDAKIEYVSGCHNGKTHAWLVVDNILVDVTADQFGNVPVIVASDSEWHAQFEIAIRRQPEINRFDADLHNDYKIITATVGSQKE